MNKRLLIGTLSILSAGALFTGCEKKEEKKEENNNQQNSSSAASEEKKLNCTISEKDDDKNTEEIKYNVTYNGDEITRIVLTSTKIYASGKFDEKDYNKVKDECKDNNDGAKGASCNTQSSGSRIIATYTFTPANYNDKGKKVAKEIGADEIMGKKYDEIKTALETAGYTCK